MDIRTTFTAAGGYGTSKTLAEIKAAQAKAVAAADARKREVKADAAKALSSPRLSTAESAKAQARQKLEQIRERLNILKKLFGNNPKEMAKALAQVFKEMKAAVEAYKDAGGKELSMSGDTVSAALASAPPSEPTSDTGDAAPAEGDTAAPAADDPPKDPTTAASDGRSLYDAVVGEVRKAIGEDGLEFLKLVRGMTGKIAELLETARGQARIRKADKDTDKAFEEADKDLKSLGQSMADMESDIHRQVPTAGMRLSIAA